MIKFFGILLLAVLLVAANKGSDLAVSEEISPSGLHFSLIHMQNSEDTSIIIAWPTDWAYREGVNQAVPYVGTDLLLAGGAEGYPPGQAKEKFADIKAQGFVSAAPQYVLGGLSFKKATQAEALKIANAHLRSPSFDPAWLDRVKDDWSKRVEEESAKPQTKLFLTMRWAIFGDQPLRSSLCLDQNKIWADVLREDVQKWHQEVFTHSPRTIVVAGTVTAKEAGAAIDKLLAGLPPASRKTSFKMNTNFAPRRILLHVADAATSQLVFVRPLPATRDGKDMEDSLILASLGQGGKSALFKTIRTDLRAAYDFSAGDATFTPDARFMFMMGEVETAKMAEVEKTVRKTYGDFQKTGPTGDLANWKSLFYEQLEKNRQAPDTASFAALQSVLDGKPATRGLNLREELDSVTTQSLMTRLNDSIYKSDDFLVIAVSPDVNALPGACVVETPKDAIKCQ